MDQRTTRRHLMKLGALGIASAWATVSGAATAPASLVPARAGSLRTLSEKLAAAPRRRDFKTVPMILNAREQWDYEALDLVIGYASPHKQVWDNTDLAGPWLNVMRNALNTQVWSFQHPDFLVASATHGTANFALFKPEIWEKYQLATLTDGKFKANTLIEDKPGAAADPADYESPEGVFSPRDNSVVALQKRGVVFLSCHNAIWELAEKLIAANANPDHLAQDALAAELTNNLVAGVVLIPGAVGTLPELQHAGFHYAR